MAVVNFYSSFEYKWGQTGGVIDFQDDQYKIGWAFIGSTPPSVEQFNKLQQLNDEKFAWLWGQFKAAADARKVTLTANDLLGLNKILAAATPDATTSVKGLTAYATDTEATALTSKTKALTPYGLGLNLKDASTTVKGLTAYATDTEATALTSKTKALTPYGLGLNLKDASTTVKGLTAYATDAEATARTSKTTALTPFGLGLNVQSHLYDTTTGKLLMVGAFGLGSWGASNTVDLWPSGSLDDVNVPSGMCYVNSTIAGRPTLDAGVVWHRQAGSSGAQLFETYTGELYHRGRRSGVYTDFARVVDTRNMASILGSAAFANLTPDLRTGSSSQALRWGFMGLGYAGVSVETDEDITALWRSGTYRVGSSPAGKPFFAPNTSGDVMFVGSWSEGYHARILISPTNDRAGFQTVANGVARGWQEFWTSKTFDPNTKADKSSTISIHPTTPTTNVGEVIYVIDRQQILYWQKIGTFTGYASPDVGRFVWGTSANARLGEINLIGGSVDRTHRNFAALIAWAEENGHVVPLAQWTPGTFKFALISGNNWRVPDLRNQFIRATGTDADTANARPLGSAQAGRLQSHDHGLQTEAGSGLGKLVLADYGHERAPWVEVAPANWNDQAASGFRVATAETGGAETRPVNIALHPRIQI